MLPKIKENLKIAIANRCRIVVVQSGESSSRTIEPCVLYTSKSKGLMLVGRQISGVTTSDRGLPAWQNFKAVDFSSLTVVDDRFDPEALEGYAEVRARIKRTPNAEIELNSAYTYLDDSIVGPVLARYDTDTMTRLKGIGE